MRVAVKEGYARVFYLKLRILTAILIAQWARTSRSCRFFILSSLFESDFEWTAGILVSFKNLLSLSSKIKMKLSIKTSHTSTNLHIYVEKWHSTSTTSFIISHIFAIIYITSTRISIHSVRASQKLIFLNFQKKISNLKEVNTTSTWWVTSITSTRHSIHSVRASQNLNFLNFEKRKSQNLKISSSSSLVLLREK